ncbi:MAG: hypothetical protein WAT20_08825 [Ferruginibacter sp.]
MKQICLFLLVCLCFITTKTSAQSLAINTDGSTANNSALLDVKSTAKGMLIPRMSRAERNAIASPATGLLIFQNGPDSIGFHYYDGTKWTWMLSNSNADSLAWRTYGNTGTNPANHFLGTTDNVPLILKTNNSEKLRVTTAGELGIGTITPNSSYGYAKVEIASEGYGSPVDLLIRNAVNDPGYAPGLIFQHARGTLATPVTVNNGDYLSAISTMNYDGSNYIISAGLDFYADGAIATGILPTRLQFATRNTAGAYNYRMTIKNDGKVGIGITAPLSRTHIHNGNFLVTGDGTSPAIEPTGAGTRMFFSPLKYAFRAGYVNSTQWDDANIGQGSIGLGFNALASNLNAIAMGENSQAKSANSVSIGSGNITETEQFAVAIGRNNHSTGYASVAMGHFSEATGHYSVSFGLRDTVTGFAAAAIGGSNKVFADGAFAGGNANTVTANYSFAGGHANAVSGGNSFAGGLSNTVSGSEAFAGGNNNTVSGNSGVALGRFNFSPSFGEATVGLFATQYSPVSATAFNANDRVFTIGNGTGAGTRSDAMVVLKNGKTGIGNAAPSAKLHVGGGTRFSVLDTGAIFLQSGNTIGSARDWKIAVTLPNGYLSFRDMGFDNSGTGAMATDAMVIAWGTGNVGIGTATPNSTLQVDGTVAIGTSLNIAGGPSGTPISLLNQKSYVGVLPANGTDNYYQLPDPTVYPGRTYIIRNNSSAFQANIATAAGLLFPGNSDVGGATYTLNPTTSPKTVMAISDGANWTIMVQN